MPTIRTSLATPTQPWEVAVAEFIAELSPSEAALYCDATLENLFYDASFAQKTHAIGSRSWRFTDRLSPLIDAIEDYGKALDVAVNTYPIALSPIWGCLRVILQVAAGAAKFQEQLVEMLGQIGDVLSRFRIYETLFARHERVLRALSKAYLVLLQFCVATKKLFARANKSKLPLSIALRGLWKPHLGDFDVYLRKIRKEADCVQKEAKTADMIESARSRELQLYSERISKRHRALAGLPSVDYVSKQAKLSRLRHQGTCAWLLSHAQYDAWLKSPRSTCLCCYGIPGSGKSVLAASLRDALLAEMASNKSAFVCYYYCDYADITSLDATRVLTSIIKQILENDFFPMDRFDEDFSCPYRHDQSPPTLSEGFMYLVGTLATFKTTFFILDGVDELDGDNQVQVLALIDSLLLESSLDIKVFVTSRTEEFRVKKAMQKYQHFQLSADKVHNDIASFVKDEIDQMLDPHPLSNDPALKQQVVDALVKGAQGLFLWAKLQLVDIREAHTKTTIHVTLADLPKDLSETYLRILRKTSESPGGRMKLDLMQRAFRWIAVARRPLRVEELEEAVGLDPSDTYLHNDCIPRGAGGKLIGDCGNLVILNEDDQTVSFAHRTVKQYLSSLQGKESDISSIIDLNVSEIEVGQLCLSYLCFSDFETQVARAPGQVHVEASLAEEVVWSSVPFGSLFRDAISWTKPWRSFPTRPSIKAVDFALPVPASVSTTDVLTRKYTLLEYVIEHWVEHTSGFRPFQLKAWTTFRHVALYLQLAFEFRPWNNSSHLSEVGSVIASFSTRKAQFSDEHRHQIAIYAWGFKRAFGSLLSLVNHEHLNIYFTYARNQNVPEGLESGWMNYTEHISAMLTNFPVRRAAAQADARVTPISKSQMNADWNGDIMVQWLRTSLIKHGASDTEQWYNFIGNEFRRWLGNASMNNLPLDTIVGAMEAEESAVFALVYYECFPYVPESSEEQWLAKVGREIVEQFLASSGPSWTWTPQKQWGFLFVLDRYLARGATLWGIAEVISGHNNDPFIGAALVAVSLAHGGPHLDVVELCATVTPSTQDHTLFEPIGPANRSSFWNLEGYTRLQPFLKVDVLSMVPALSNALNQLNDALTEEDPPIRRDLATTALLEITQIWASNRRCYDVSRLICYGCNLLQIALEQGTCGAIFSIIPMYRKYASSPKGEVMIRELLRDCSETADITIRGQIQSLLEPAYELASTPRRPATTPRIMPPVYAPPALSADSQAYVDNRGFLPY